MAEHEQEIDVQLHQLQIATMQDCKICLRKLQVNEKRVQIEQFAENKSPPSQSQVTFWESLNGLKLLDNKMFGIFTDGKVCWSCSLSISRIYKDVCLMKTSVEKLTDFQGLTPNNILSSSYQEPEGKLCYICMTTNTKLKLLKTVMKHTTTTLQKGVNEVRKSLGLDELLMDKGQICEHCCKPVEEYSRALYRRIKTQQQLGLHRIDVQPQIRPALSPTGVTPTRKKPSKSEELTAEEKLKFKRLVTSEMLCLVEKSGWKDSNVTNLSEINLGEMQDFVTLNCPTLCLLFEDNQGSCKVGPKEIMALSILGFSRNQRFNLLQKAIGFDIFRNVSSEQMEILNNVGVCTSRKTAYRTADDLNENNAFKLSMWKWDEEKFWCDAFNIECPSKPFRQLKKGVRRSLNSDFEDEDSLQGTTITLQIDNLDYQQVHRHQSVNHNTNMINDSTGLFLRNRIPVESRSIDFKFPLELPLEEFYLNAVEKEILRSELIRVLRNIVRPHILCMQKTAVIVRKPSIFENNASKKSMSIATGVLTMPLNSIKTAIKVMKELKVNFPRVSDEILPMRVGGDGSTFVMLHAARSLKTASHPSESLNFLWPSSSCSGLHRNMALMGRMFKIFGPNNSSLNSPGSLQHIKRTQGYKSATSKVTDSFNHCYDLLEAIAHGFGTLQVMKHLGISKLDEIPVLSEEDLNQLIDKSICSSIDEILEISTSVSPSELKKCSACSSKAISNLKECSNETCSKYIHVKCGITLQQQGAKRGKRGASTYFCSDQCADRIYNYTLSLLHFTLKFMSRRETCRYMDGENMLLHNKEDLDFFILNGNTQYTRIAHHLITSQNGCVPSQIAFDEKWNWAMSLRGGLGKNIPNDHGLECKVRGDKREIKQQSGNPSSNSTSRRTKLGQAGMDVHQGLQAMSLFKHIQSTPKHREYIEETKDFVKTYQNEHLLVKMGKRWHPGCENFKYQYNHTDVSKKNSKITSLSEELDLTQKLMKNYSFLPSVSKPFEDYVDPPCLKGKTDWMRIRPLADNIDVRQVKDVFPKSFVPNDMQFDMAAALVQNRDVVVSLPCGFGKSFIYVFATLWMHVSRKNSSTVAIIISPLLSIIRDQIKMLEGLGLNGFHVTGNNELEDLLPTEGVQFLFVTPEFMDVKGNFKLISKMNPSLVCVDEAHLLSDWGGEKFRIAMHHIGDLRSFYKGPILAMSATLTEEAISVVKEQLIIKQDALISLSSGDRPNIFYSVRPVKELTQFVNSVIDGIKLYGPKFPKTVIYVDSHAELNKLYRNLMRNLENYAYFGNENCFETRMIHLYYGEQDDPSKEFIESKFKEATSSVRIVIATVAFGLGVDIPDIRISTYIQSSHKDEVPISQFLQCIGRAARDGEPGLGIIFARNLNYQRCYKDKLHECYNIEGEDLNVLSCEIGHQVDCEINNDECGSGCLCCECTCCDFCRKGCPCQKDNIMNYQEYFLPTINVYDIVDDMNDEDELLDI